MPTPGHEEHRLAVQGISARVVLWSGVQRRRESGGDLDQRGRRARVEGADDPNTLHVRVGLTAVLQDGATVTSGQDDTRRGLGAIWHRYRGPRLSDDPAIETELLDHSYQVGLADIEDAVNQMLGRDSEQHRPPRLAWGQLIDALAGAGLAVSEQKLIDAPLTLELSPEVRAQLADM